MSRRASPVLAVAPLVGRGLIARRTVELGQQVGRLAPNPLGGTVNPVDGAGLTAGQRLSGIIDRVHGLLDGPRRAFLRLLSGSEFSRTHVHGRVNHILAQVLPLRDLLGLLKGLLDSCRAVRARHVNRAVQFAA